MSFHDAATAVITMIEHDLRRGGKGQDAGSDRLQSKVSRPDVIAMDTLEGHRVRQYFGVCAGIRKVAGGRCDL